MMLGFDGLVSTARNGASEEKIAAATMREGSEKAQNTELGRGTIDWKPVLGAAAEAGTEWHLFEQNCEDRSALESIRTSYEYLKSLDAV